MNIAPPIEIVRRCAKAVRIITEAANPVIAATAKQRPSFPCAMAVVNMKPVHGAIPHDGLPSVANGARVALLMINLVPFFRRHIVFKSKINDSDVWRYASSGIYKVPELREIFKAKVASVSVGKPNITRRYYSEMICPNDLGRQTALPRHINVSINNLRSGAIGMPVSGWASWLNCCSPSRFAPSKATNYVGVINKRSVKNLLFHPHNIPLSDGGLY